MKNLVDRFYVKGLGMFGIGLERVKASLLSRIANVCHYELVQIWSKISNLARNY